MDQCFPRALLLTAMMCALSVPVARANHHEHTDHHDHAAHPSDAGNATAAIVNGEVRRIDAENRKLTIRHEAIPAFEMAAMTMIFAVADTVALDQLKAGDKIRFSLKKIEGKWRVITVEKTE